MLLDKEQVSLIEADVQRARITLSHLSQELVDHICCEVETLMHEGKNFDEAYALIKQETGIHVLQKIQENTLYLINKKYAFMRTTMKITGNISLILLGFGTLMKIYNIATANVILVVGFTLLGLVFFPFAIYFNYTEKKAGRAPVLNLSVLMGGIAFMAGILFKVMHWPGANVLLLSGWLLILLVFLPILLYMKLKESVHVGEKRIYVLGVFSLVLVEVATMFKFFHWPGASVLMVLGCVLLVSVFLPIFTYTRFKESGKITGQFIYLVIISMYAIALTTLLAVNPIQHTPESTTDTKKIPAAIADMKTQTMSTTTTYLLNH